MSADNAYWSLQIARPGNCARARRTIQYVEDAPPNHLRAADGQVMKIPMCMISKVWRRDNEAWMKANPHLIDTTLSKKPDTLAFVTAHPAPAELEGEEDAQDEEAGEIEQRGEEEGGNGGADMERGYEERGYKERGYEEGGYEEGGYVDNRWLGGEPDGTNAVEVTNIDDGGVGGDNRLYASDLAQAARSDLQDLLPSQMPAIASIQPQGKLLFVSNNQARLPVIDTRALSD